MDLRRYWMRMKMKPECGSTMLNPSYGESWEEQAFAEDAAGGLGGCVWPPRCYSCNFCRREFKSAQALGGHMNVHRRDRARLKLSPNPDLPFLPSPNQFSTPHNSPCTLMYNQPSDSDQGNLLTSPSLTVRVSSVPNIIEDYASKSNCFAPPFFSRILDENNQTQVICPESWSKVVADRGHFFVSDSKNDDMGRKAASDLKWRYSKDGYEKGYLSANLSFLNCRPQENESVAEDIIPSYKRRRIDTPSFSWFPRSSSDERVLKVSPKGLEDLDLELRLGDPPKGEVK